MATQHRSAKFVPASVAASADPAGMAREGVFGRTTLNLNVPSKAALAHPRDPSQATRMATKTIDRAIGIHA